MTQLEKAKQKYQENLRNYNHYKDIVDDFYVVGAMKYEKSYAKNAEVKMNHCYDILETLTYIFGREVQQ